MLFIQLFCDNFWGQPSTSLFLLVKNNRESKRMREKDLKDNKRMRKKIVQKLSQNNCSYIISLFSLSPYISIYIYIFKKYLNTLNFSTFNLFNTYLSLYHSSCHTTNLSHLSHHFLSIYFSLKLIIRCMDVQR